MPPNGDGTWSVALPNRTQTYTFTQPSGKVTIEVTYRTV